MQLSSPSWKRSVPWWAKLGARVALARLPVDYKFWRSLSLFRHGGMEDPSWAFETFNRHYHAADFPHKGDGFVTLEGGSGDSLFSALIARAYGGSRTYLVDAGRFANFDPALYRSMIAYLREQGLPLDGLEDFGTAEAVLNACGAEYHTNGLESFRSLPDASVDFLFTNGMFPVVPRAEVLPILKEFRRVLKPDGLSSHSIGIYDCLGDALNHLRFSEKAWESRWIRGSGVYTNRYRFSEYLELFEEAGLRPEPTEVNRWDALPTPRQRLAPEFQKFDDDDLRVYSFNLVARPAVAPVVA